MVRDYAQVALRAKVAIKKKAALVEKLRKLLEEMGDLDWEAKAVRTPIQMQIIRGIGLLKRFEATKNLKKRREKYSQLKNPDERNQKLVRMEYLRQDRIFIQNKANRYYRMLLQDILGTENTEKDNPYQGILSEFSETWSAGPIFVGEDESRVSGMSETANTAIQGSNVASELTGEEDEEDEERESRAQRVRKAPDRFTFDSYASEPSAGEEEAKKPPKSVPYEDCIPVYEEEGFSVEDIQLMEARGSDIVEVLFRNGMSDDDLRREWLVRVPFPGRDGQFIYLMVVIPGLTGQPPLEYTLADVIREVGRVGDVGAA